MRQMFFVVVFFVYFLNKLSGFCACLSVLWTGSDMYYTMRKHITFLTWNIRGFGSQTKTIKVLNHLNKLQADICLLQETHLSESDHNKIKSSQYNHLFLAHYNTKQRGVCILISKKTSHLFITPPL